MKAKRLAELGIPSNAIGAAIKIIQKVHQDHSAQSLEQVFTVLVQEPDSFVDHEVFGEVAKIIVENNVYEIADPAPYEQWGEGLEEQAVEQMRVACTLPVARRGALMPDAHLGYGLPIGGVLGVKNAVIPYAVGVDIACRMKLTVFDLPLSYFEEKENVLKSAIDRETRFGVGASFDKKQDHPVMDEDWNISKVVASVKDKAWSQIGSSGSGNHFCEFGELSLEQDDLGLKAGTYLALLTHSGSRGAGATIAGHYSKLAMSQRPYLSREQKHLAWLDMDSQEGREYWAAMNLMGRYAAANHELIHRNIAKNLGVDVLLDVENHHNFAWKEEHNGEELIVHRKGATPAGEGVLGIIPGSMGDPGFVVRGKGKESSLRSASHGAGRRMSRKAARQKFNWKDVQEYLKERRVKLISAGLDEVPMAYKNIVEVMGHQKDLVDTVARFNPRLVKMAPAGERPED